MTNFISHSWSFLHANRLPALTSAITTCASSSSQVDKAATRITEEVEDENANIIFGSALDESMHESLRVSIVATGIEDPVY